jgi:hypothetical protein
MMGSGGFEGLMNNPMLQQVSSNPSSPFVVDKMLSNTTSQMAERFSGGNMPDIGQLMSDPSVRQFAEQFRGNNAAGTNGNAAAGPSSSSNNDMYS